MNHTTAALPEAHGLDVTIGYAMMPCKHIPYTSSLIAKIPSKKA